MSGIPSWAVKGAKVVCIKGGDSVARQSNGWVPVTGETYTVRSVGVWPNAAIPVCLRLVEHRSEFICDGKEAGWNIDRFRPLITRTQEQDVALFEPLLTSSKPSERIPALTDDELETQAREAVKPGASI